jgi:hypothetical protein
LEEPPGRTRFHTRIIPNRTLKAITVINEPLLPLIFSVLLVFFVFEVLVSPSFQPTLQELTFSSMEQRFPLLVPFSISLQVYLFLGL